MKAKISLSNEEGLQLANLLCKKISIDLDADDRSSLDSIGNVLQTLPTEAVLFAVRCYVSIERCIGYCLDEHEIWGPLLTRINKIDIRF